MPDPDAQMPPSKKRKSRSQDEKPAKRAKKVKGASARDASLDIDTGINTAFASMDPDLLADHLAKQTKRFDQDLSLVELEERRIPVAGIRDTTDFEHERTLDRMPDFLKLYCKPKRTSEELSKAAKAKGAPHTIVVTSSGLRAADVARSLRTFQTKEAVVAKLFAKHIKLEEARKYVQSTRIGIGVGTPRRIIDLLEGGALSSEKLERIVIDVSHIDQKKRGILDMKELQPPLMDLLNRQALKERYGAGSTAIELLFF